MPVIGCLQAELSRLGLSNIIGHVSFWSRLCSMMFTYFLRPIALVHGQFSASSHSQNALALTL